MRVIKRSGDEVPMLFDKVVTRIKNLCDGLNVQADKVAQKVFNDMYDGIKTSEIDDLSADVAIHMITEDPDYESLATRLVISNIQKNSPKCFSDSMLRLYSKGTVSEEFMKNVSLDIDAVIDHSRDYLFGFFGIKTLQKMYLNEGETPQYMFMRVAVSIHKDNFQKIKETYDLMSQLYFTHATPTLFNAGAKRQQMSSCFVEGTPVFTTNRGPVPIEKVEIGDLVVTHTGSTKPVMQTHKNMLGDRTLFDVKVYKTPSVE